MNPKGEMKGSAITGPVGKEAAELWPVCCKPRLVSSPDIRFKKGLTIYSKRIASNSGVVM